VEVDIQYGENFIRLLENSSFTSVILLTFHYGRNVARTWAYETACILRCEKELDKNLPYNRYFEYFGPEYKLEVKATNMDDLNEGDNYLEGIK